MVGVYRPERSELRAAVQILCTNGHIPTILRDQTIQGEVSAGLPGSY